MAATDKAQEYDVPAVPNASLPSNFASRRAARIAREAATGGPPPDRMLAFRAGIDSVTPDIVITHSSN